MQKNVKKSYLKRLAVLGVMTALAAVCSITFPMGLTVRVGDFMKLSPAFLIIGIVGNMYGWKESALVAFLSDLIQSLMFGGFSPLISLIALLSGACFGWLLKGTKSVSKIIFSVLTTQIVGSFILTTTVLCIWYSLPLFPTIYFRILQTVILIAVEIPVLILFIKVLNIGDKLKKISN